MGATPEIGERVENKIIHTTYTMFQPPKEVEVPLVDLAALQKELQSKGHWAMLHDGSMMFVEVGPGTVHILRAVTQ